MIRKSGYRFSEKIMLNQQSLPFRGPVGVGQLKRREVETRRDGAADQRPRAETARRLPRMRRHDCLRPLAGGEVGAEAQGLSWTDACDRQFERGARIVVPDLGGIDAVPVR